MKQYKGIERGAVTSSWSSWTFDSTAFNGEAEICCSKIIERIFFAMYALNFEPIYRFSMDFSAIRKTYTCQEDSKTTITRF